MKTYTVGMQLITWGTMPLKFCFIIPDMRSGFVIICSCADFCSDFWFRMPVLCRNLKVRRGSEAFGSLISYFWAPGGVHGKMDGNGGPPWQ